MTETTTLDLELKATSAVDLPGLATSGYSWVYELSDPAVAKVSHEYIVAPDSKPGARGIDRFTITALQAGQCVLELKQIRSWEKDKAPINSRKIQISVK